MASWFIDYSLINSNIHDTYLGAYIFWNVFLHESPLQEIQLNLNLKIIVSSCLIKIDMGSKNQILLDFNQWKYTLI